MKLTILLTLGLVVFGQPTDMTDTEKLEIIRFHGSLTDLYTKAQKAQQDAESYQQVYKTRLEELKKNHNAENCEMDGGLRFVNCKPAPPPAKDAKKK